ncbi:LysM peptidoglycan-binding domain-containing protein [Deinococcus sp.]|uniref:LysM peptidoglycan-binding domain-containing protein n=1 Tax=Deinococcus sp. TaxID=47478 RepID=UPI0025C53C67|nr:LysM peptidoglycan-binding domain-containing protein [Deinococcus sp.]
MWPFGKNTTDRIKDAINANPVLSPLGLNVQEQGGTVKVVGQVQRQSQVGLINAVVGGISGVKTVDVSGVSVLEQASAPADISNVQIGDIVQQSAGEAQFDDKAFEDQSRVAKEVLSAVRGNGELADNPIDVLQSGSSVVLRGAVDSDHELRLLQQVAQGVSGVTGVDVSGVSVRAGAKELSKEKDQSTGDTVYTVKSGDTLSAIAQKYYGDEMRYKDIAHFNNISNPDAIQVGQQIRIPG